MLVPVRGEARQGSGIPAMAATTAVDRRYETPPSGHQVVLADRSRVSTTTAPAPTMPAMATLTLRHHITGLRRDASSQVTGPDCDTLQLLAGTRAAALTALGDVPVISHADQYRLIDVWMEVGQDETWQQQHDDGDGAVTAGTLDLVVQVQVPDEIAYAYNTPESPLRPFMDAVQGAVDQTFLALPNSGADLYAGLGFEGAAIMYGSSIRYYGHG